MHELPNRKDTTIVRISQICSRVLWQILKLTASASGFRQFNSNGKSGDYMTSLCITFKHESLNSGNPYVKVQIPRNAQPNLVWYTGWEKIMEFVSEVQ